MGTNIYARVNPPKAEREKFVLKVKAIVDSNELFMFSKLNDLLQEYKEEYPEVHLGKRSCGWQFLWAPNPKWYDNTIESIDKFLRREDVVYENNVSRWLLQKARCSCRFAEMQGMQVLRFRRAKTSILFVSTA